MSGAKVGPKIPKDYFIQNRDIISVHYMIEHLADTKTLFLAVIMFNQSHNV